jgi:hypothetical protein
LNRQAENPERPAARVHVSDHRDFCHLISRLDKLMNSIAPATDVYAVFTCHNPSVFDEQTRDSSRHRELTVHAGRHSAGSAGHSPSRCRPVKVDILLTDGSRKGRYCMTEHN